MKIRKSAMMVLLLGFLVGLATPGQEKVSINEQLVAVKGKIELVLPEETTNDPGLKTEFTTFFQDLVEELKKQAGSLSHQQNYTLTVDLRVKPKSRQVVFTIEPKTGQIFIFTDRYLAKDPKDEKPYQEYLTALVGNILQRFIKS